MTNSTWILNKREILNNKSAKDGMTIEEQYETYKSLWEFITTVSNHERLQLVTYIKSTAQSLIYRYYTKKSMKDDDPYNIATSAIFLACKLDESRKSVKLIYNCASEVYPELFIGFEDPLTQMLVLEMDILKAMTFDLLIDHPYNYLDDYYKKVTNDNLVLQAAWNFCNDSMQINFCLRYLPKTLAAAYVILGGLHRSLSVESWYDVLGVDEYIVKSTEIRLLKIGIGNELFELYSEFDELRDSFKDYLIKNKEKYKEKYEEKMRQKMKMNERKKIEREQAEQMKNNEISTLKSYNTEQPIKSPPRQKQEYYRRRSPSIPRKSPVRSNRRLSRSRSNRRRSRSRSNRRRSRSRSNRKHSRSRSYRKRSRSNRRISRSRSYRRRSRSNRKYSRSRSNKRYSKPYRKSSRSRSYKRHIRK